MPRSTAADVLLVTLLAPACSGNGSRGEATPPPAGEPSAREGVPLPVAAEPQADPARPSAEVYRLPAETTLAEADAFYAKEADGKPLQQFDWCGKVFTGRIWTRTATDGSQKRLEVVLDEVVLDEDASRNVVVRVSRTTAPTPVTCPPEPPEGAP